MTHNVYRKILIGDAGISAFKRLNHSVCLTGTAGNVVDCCFHSVNFDFGELRTRNSNFRKGDGWNNSILSKTRIVQMYEGVILVALANDTSICFIRAENGQMRKRHTESDESSTNPSNQFDMLVIP